MTKPQRPELDDYYRQAESWNHDREASSRHSRRIAWTVASVAGLIALAEACALVALTPLKTVQPYTLLVYKQTGYVQALAPLDPQRVGADTALTQSFVVQYVIARESFDVTTLQTDYRKVAAWSEGSARSDYIAAVQASNPASPLATLPRTSLIVTRIKSVSPIGSHALLVRFDTQRRDQAGDVGPARPWVAVVQYRYSGEPQKLEDRLVNPLGFRVVHYQRNAEAPPPPAEASTPVDANARVTMGAEQADSLPAHPATPASYPAATAAASGYSANRPTPSPLLAVPHPRYVTQFPSQTYIGTRPPRGPIVGPGSPVPGTNP